MERPKISVCVITYKQEDVIRRTMDSLVCQKDFLYEICINDDCSPDNTFKILKEYEQTCPELVKPVQNEQNLGICQNIEAAEARLTGDVVYFLSGDDVCPDGYFQKVLAFIEQKKIDWKNELFCIYGDFKEIEPDGCSNIFKNNLVLKYDAVKLHHRKLISNRSACFSRKILDKFEQVATDRSYNAEWAYEIQLPLFTEKNYYLPALGNIYYAGIGVSAEADMAKAIEHLAVGYDLLVDFLERHNRPLDKKDLAFIEFMRNHQTNHKFKAFIYFWRSLDFSLGVHGIGLNRIHYAIIKRLRRMTYKKRGFCKKTLKTNNL